MDGCRPTLAELHRRYDGPIEDRMREAALTGRPRPAAWSLALASRDIDRLALSTVRARARVRATTHREGGPNGVAPKAASTDVLFWYRALGVRTIVGRDALERAGPA